MAVNLSIKGVPEPLAARLRARAERNHRSLQGELMAIVNEAVRDEPATARSTQSGSIGVDVGTPVGWKTVEQVWAELRLRFPQPTGDGRPIGVDIIRADRDSR